MQGVAEACPGGDLVQFEAGHLIPAEEVLPFRWR